MKCLVTGGAGFIGSHIVDALALKGHEVLIIDNLSTGKKENINPAAKFYEIDLTDFAAVEQLLKGEKPEVVFHHAAQIDLRISVDDPIKDAQTNILASFALIKASYESGIKKFIFASTGGAIYGDTDNRPSPETEKEWPLSPYGIAKLTVDKFLYYYSQVHGLNFTSLRYANIYGPRQNPHGEAGVVAIFINKMLNQQQPIINGDGRQTRDYVYVEDVVKANLLALDNFEKQGIYNVGTAREIDVNYLFNEINKQFENKFEEVHGPAKIGEQKTSCLSYEKIKNDFAWKPEVNFEEGIKRTVELWKKI